MTLSCGVDLHSTDCWVSVVEEGDQVVREKKIDNDLEANLGFLEPHREEVEGVAVESTFNWYWLVIESMGAGYRVHLTSTWAAKQREGLKYADDRHDGGG